MAQRTFNAAEDIVSRYEVVKHSWKGKYTRIFCIGNEACATIDPKSIFALTNVWEYATAVIDCTPNPKSVVEFVLTTRKGSGSHQQTFSTPTAVERLHLLTDFQRFRKRFDPAWAPLERRHSFTTRKMTHSEAWDRRELIITNVGILQCREQRVIGTYYFVNVLGFSTLRDDPSGLVILTGGNIPKMHLYMLDGRTAQEFVSKAAEFALKYVGEIITLDDGISMHNFELSRLGVDRQQLAVVTEFPVAKITPKHDSSPRRLLGTTEKFMVERDPSTYNTTAVYSFSDVYCLVRSELDQQQFSIEFRMMRSMKAYTSPMRDALLAHLLDCCRAAGNHNVSVRLNPVDRSKRTSPLCQHTSEEIESTLLRCLVDPQKYCGSVVLPFVDVLRHFNANVEHRGLRVTENREGLFAENREKLIFNSLMSLMNHYHRGEDTDPATVAEFFFAMRRLCVTRVGYSSAAVVPTLVKGVGAVSVQALRLGNATVSHAVIDFICSLMTPHHDHYDAYHEQVNKNRMLASESFLRHLMTQLASHIAADSGALVVQSLLDFVVFALCPPYGESTSAESFAVVMRMVVECVSKRLFILLGHRCRSIRYAAGMIIRIVLEEGDEESFFFMQRGALSEGGFLRMFHTAAFGTDRPHRDLARRLVALWAHDNPATKELMIHMVPITMLHFLESSESPPMEEVERERKASVISGGKDAKGGWFRKRFNPGEAAGMAQDQARIVTPRARCVRVEPRGNWNYFFYQLKQDHMRPDLIWTYATRNELREALEAEIEAYQAGLEMQHDRAVCWNYQEFEVKFPSLADELRIGNHYPRLLFETSNPVIARPREFFNDMYHRFLLVQDFSMKTQCLHGMELLYRHYSEDIGQFNDIEFVLKMLEGAEHPVMRDRLLLFIQQLLRFRGNVKPFIDANGMRPLVDLVTLAHLHVDRPQLHTTVNAIEAAAGTSTLDLQDAEKEWHYATPGGERHPPVSYRALRKLLEDGTIQPTTKVWAQGLSAWRDLRDVPQLRWGLLHPTTPTILTLTEVTTTILDILLLLCAYYPSRDEDGAVMMPMTRVKRYLSDGNVLPHVVQLLLTFDPSIVHRTHALLAILIDEDNPVMGRFYLTGVFYFAMMYMGSDILPMCRLLANTHARQAGRSSANANANTNGGLDHEALKGSALTPLLPPSLVCYLSYHGAEKFAQIFLGEYETPEAIWGREMRRVLVEKISVHVGDFSPRVIGNVRAVYQYCPIGGVEYEPLRNELFCAQYYLRHLCDEARYPNWPIADPKTLMRETLSAWKRELEKTPCTLSRASCLEELEVTEKDPSPATVRKAYFKLAAAFHPDKNPAGRDRFEAIQQAYEFLISEKSFSDAADPIRISLLLRTQSILFTRFPEVMSKFKYAGYGLLLKLVQTEYEDPAMLRKDPCLMRPAAELCAHTVNNVEVNADELLHEGGLELLANVTARCFELMMTQTTDAENHASIAKDCMRTFDVSSKFAECRERLRTLPIIPHLASRGVAYRKAPAMSRACVYCCETLCLDPVLQSRVIRAGCLWHLLRYLFRYDSTLAESGVEINEVNHTQLFANRAAKGALRTVYALTGIRPDESYLETVAQPTLYQLLQHLLTPYVVRRMRKMPDGEDAILKILNTNHETPQLLWNNTTRAELLDFIERRSDAHRDASLETEDSLPKYDTGDFQFDTYAKELIVGGVFIRIYNEQPTFALDEPPAALISMLQYIQKFVQDGASKGVASVLQAVRNLIVAVPSVQSHLLRFIPSLVRCLTLEGDRETSVQAFGTLGQGCAQAECIQACVECPETIPTTVLALEDGDEERRRAGLLFLQQLFTSRPAVQTALDLGVYVVLLWVFVSSKKEDTKDAACGCLARIVADKLNGQKAFLRCTRIIPVVMMETITRNPSQASYMFDTFQETPEMLWTAEKKARCIEILEQCRKSVVESIRAEPTALWKIPEELLVERSDEIQVAGVYLHQFLKQPTWSVRKPREFLTALLDRFVQIAEATGANQNAEVLELVASCAAVLLEGQSSIGDYVASLGYSAKLCVLCESPDVVVSQSSVGILRELAANKLCVDGMTHCDPIASLLAAMDRAPDHVGAVMQTMERLMERSSEASNMVQRGMKAQLPQKLLHMLESGMTTSAQPAATRAAIANVLKAMERARDPIVGGQLQALLDASPVWAKYKNHSHDLFLTGTEFGGLLTGPRQAAALALTAPPAARDDTVPPPLP